MSTPEKFVYIIEDDESLGISLKIVLDASGFSTKVFYSAQSFQKFCKEVPSAFNHPGCLVFDVRLPDMTGPDLYIKIRNEHKHSCLTALFVTGHGDTEMAVNLMKLGAFDYLSKPFNPHHLIEKLEAAYERSLAKFDDLKFVLNFSNKAVNLSPHEKMVMKLMMEHMTTKEIAENMDNSTRTVEVHRANVLKKMECISAAELAQKNERYLLLSEFKP
jgi:FixJ family two-component response regulator